jgi:hypothetical protein
MPPTSNKAMADRLRGARDELSSYMYQAPEASTDDLAEPPLPPDEVEGAAPEDFTVLEPGDEADPEKYTYELAPGSPGAWMVYPPGVPCESTGQRIQTSGPASASELTEMEAALGGGTAPSERPSTPSVEGAY